jgi:hypothetical protein
MQNCRIKTEASVIFSCNASFFFIKLENYINDYKDVEISEMFNVSNKSGRLESKYFYRINFVGRQTYHSIKICVV